MKIALVLLRTLGDVVIGNTLVNEIKRTYPDSDIYYYVEKSYLEVINCNPNLKEVIVLPCLDAVLLDIAEKRYDKVFFPYQTTREDNIWHQVEKHRHQHLLDFYAKRCGIEIKDRKLFGYFNDEQRKKVKLYASGIVIHISTLVPSKNWDKFSELVLEIKRKYPMIPIYQVGKKEEPLIADVIDTREKFTIGELYAFLKKSTMLIGLDSGVSYMAAAVNIPVICIMGATIPMTSGPIGEKVHHIVAETKCEPRCHGNCRFDNPCIRKITIEQVMEKVKEIIR